MAYKDEHGYKREHSNAIHRHRAYHHIYLKDRKKYPLPFEAYEVHHIDGDKNNNKMDNLAVLTPEEHDKAHQELDEEMDFFIQYGVTIEKFQELLQQFEEWGISKEQVSRDFHNLTKKDELKYAEMGLFLPDRRNEITGYRIDTLEKAWEILFDRYEKEYEKKLRNDKIKGHIKNTFKKIFKRE